MTKEEKRSMDEIGNIVADMQAIVDDPKSTTQECDAAKLTINDAHALEESLEKSVAERIAANEIRKSYFD